jgi:hypothetical protein
VNNAQAAGSSATDRRRASCTTSTNRGVGRYLGAASPQNVIVIGVATVFIPEIAQGQDILVVYEAKWGRVNLSALTHASPAFIALDLANWAT